MSEPQHARLPYARSNDVVAEKIGAETVVYDGRTKEAHCLAALAAVVFEAADGRTSLETLSDIASAKLGEQIDVAAIEAAVAELESCGLLESGPADAEEVGISRRGALQRGALVGAAAFAAPLVTSLVTPEYGAASSLSSLSYVVAVFKGSDNQYYRVKKGQDGVYLFGWTDATPGTNCTFDTSGKTLNTGAITNVVIHETAGTPTTVTITWDNKSSQPVTWTLVDLRVKCANQCNVSVSGGTCTTGANGSCSAGPFPGC